MKRLLQLGISLFLVLGCLASSALAQSGKIAGTVTEASNGDPLPGVNVVIEGTTQGAITDADGYYTILNVSPGTYDVRASFVGFRPQVIENVRVNIDLTTNVDFEIHEEAVGLDEVVVEAFEPVVKRDISANVANLSAEEVENIATTTSLEDVIGLQAGAEGLSIRGGGLDELSFQVDGISMRSGRNNSPFTGISFTSIDAIQVQTGGFNAEYGNVRSGLVNVVTKEGSRTRYTADVLMEYTPAAQKNFGGTPRSFNSYWTRPFVDPDVAFVGTHSPDSPWDVYDQRQYPRWEGYDAIAQAFADDEDRTNDLTPEQIQEGWEWFHRKDFTIADPDYTIDGTIGGPVPGISRALGDLRFMASYRQTQNAYVIPMERDAFEDRTGMLKLTSNLASGIKLSLHGMYAEQAGHQLGWGGVRQSGIVSCCAENSIFSNNKVGISDVDRLMFGAKLTHSLSSNTFYEVQLQRNETDYFTIPGPPRDTTTQTVLGGKYPLSEVPFGWWGPYETFLSFTHGGHEYSISYDTSSSVVWDARFDITSQLNRYSLLKAGVEYVANDNQIRYENRSDFITFVNRRWNYRQTPQQGAAYLQNKFEFEGLVANIGLRLDYFSPGDGWYQFDPFDRALSAGEGGADALDENLQKGDPTRQFQWSPRLGVSFPISTYSKLFLNYGHFRQMLDPSTLFLVEQDFTGRVAYIGNPAHPMPKTVAYELGYEHSLLEQYLLRITGYYKALDEQSRNIQFVSIDNSVNYYMSEPFNYEDIRGLELSLAKNSGDWVRGFANFTYMARKEGNFGFGQQYENRRQQRDYERRSTENIQWAPVPEPFARVNLELRSPNNWGPEVMGANPLGGWRMNWLGSWRLGQATTWTGGAGSLPGVRFNLRWRDEWNLNLRLAKDITTTAGDVKIYADVSNVLNNKRMWGGAFNGSQDYENYMRSLHLPESVFEKVEGGAPYGFVPGDDQPGDYRKEGVEFVPIEVVGDLPEAGMSRTMGRYGPLYYVEDEGQYYVWRDGAFAVADDSKVQEVIDQKAYIDMPNMRSLTFLFPRQITLGIRVSL